MFKIKVSILDEGNVYDVIDHLAPKAVGDRIARSS